MANYMIAYHGGNSPETPEAGAQQMGKWKAWVAGLGEALVNSGTPLMGTKVLTSSGVRDNADPEGMKGFAVVKADTIEAAVELAKSDPFLEMGGSIHVSQMMEMS